MTRDCYYYEFSNGQFHLLFGEDIHSFGSRAEMLDFIEDPAALIIEVTPENWARLYDEGAFHG